MTSSQIQIPLYEMMEPYVEAEFRLTLLKGKKPIEKNWPNTTRAANDVLADAKQRKCNVGVVLDSKHLIIDIDPRNYVDGKNSLEELIDDLKLDKEALFKCPNVETGGGGFHLYYLKPADLRTASQLKDYPGIDFKTKGGQVVAAGSIHPETNTPYKAKFDSVSLKEIRLASGKLLELLKVQPLEKPEGSGHEDWGILTPEMLARNLDQLDPDEFINHDDWFLLLQASHHATAGLGKEEFISWSIKAKGYEDHRENIDMRWDSLKSIPSDNQDPVTVKTLFKVMVDKGLAPDTRNDPEDDFEALEPLEESKKKYQSRFIFLNDREIENIPPPRWLIEGFLTQESIATMYGSPESFKSFIALSLACSIAYNVNWHGNKIVPGKVLYIAAEGVSGLSKRLKAWKEYYNIRGFNDNFNLLTCAVNFSTEKDTNDLVNDIGYLLDQVSFIVIDTLNQTAAGLDENSAKDMGLYLSSMKQLRDKTKATILIVHHSGKDKSKGMRGSTAILGAMDTTIEVMRKNDSLGCDVAVRKQKDGERAKPLELVLQPVKDSLVTTMITPIEFFEENDDTKLKALISELYHSTNNTQDKIKYKILLDALLKSDNSLSDKTARRQIDALLKEGITEAILIRNLKVWVERKDQSNKRSQKFIRFEIVDSAC